MRRLAFTLVLSIALAVPVMASADVPPAAVAVCQAEYAQLGADAFVAKYGPTEPWGHCYAAHTSTATTSPTTTTTTTDSRAAVACKAEYLKLGADAFAAKYGAPETFGNCIRSNTTTPTTTNPPQPTTDNPAVAACKAEYLKLGADVFAAKYGGKEALGQCVKLRGRPQPTTSDAAMSVATALCQTLAKTLGTAFFAKYGPQEAMGNCVRASLATARSLLASCRASSGASKDAFKACLIAGLQPRRR